MYGFRRYDDFNLSIKFIKKAQPGGCSFEYCFCVHLNRILLFYGISS